MAILDEVRLRGATAAQRFGATARQSLARGDGFALAAALGLALFALTALNQGGPAAASSVAPQLPVVARPEIAPEPVAPSPISASARAAPIEATADDTVAAPAEEAAPPPPADVAPKETPAAATVAPTAAATRQPAALDLDVRYYWPKTPQTVERPTKIVTAPGKGDVIEVAQPGERLRINGRTSFRGAEWIRVRTPEGKDGFFNERTIDVSTYRRRRAEAARAVRLVDPSLDYAAAPFAGSTPPPAPPSQAPIY